MTFPCRSRQIFHCLQNYCSLVINWRVSLFIAGGIFMYCQENGICLCPVIKVRSEELQTISNTICRIRDKSQKSLISTYLRFWDRCQSIYVSVNSRDITNIQARHVLFKMLFTWPQVVWDLTSMKSKEPDMFTPIYLSLTKAAQNHNTLCNYYFGLMVGQTNILSGFLSKPI